MSDHDISVEETTRRAAETEMPGTPPIAKRRQGPASALFRGPALFALFKVSTKDMIDEALPKAVADGFGKVLAPLAGDMNAVKR